MSNIHYIKNVTAFNNFKDVPGIFQVQLQAMPDFTPDDVIIRGINFNGVADDVRTYLLWTNINNSIIASFCGGAISSNYPQTVMRLTSPLPNILEFKILTPSTGVNNAELVDLFNGDLVIHLDFIKYKKT
jgi:hypothetical protein